jgi:uncharacterized protein (DUF2126 family)
MTDNEDDFEAAVAAHDASVAASGLQIWVGNEPTFTDRFSSGPEWVTGALGDDKRARALRLLATFAEHRPGCAVLRSVGRQYPGEPEPRWAYGLYARRDGAAVWSGPRDPILARPRAAADVRRPDRREGADANTDASTDVDVGSQLGGFHEQLRTRATDRGFPCAAFRGPADWRLVLARDPGVALPKPDDSRLFRPSVHGAPIPTAGLQDPMGADGLLLLIVSQLRDLEEEVACVDLPAIAEVALFLRVLTAIAEAADVSGLPSLVLRGFPPPVDASVSFATVTPDPAVVEVNMAPHPNVAEFLRDNRRVFAAAGQAGLAPYRLHYTGVVADSGGGGQITFGGPSPERSPFFVQPRLLPRLVRYALRHPSLSYLFAHDFIGASGQSVRPDEHGLDALAELKLALALLDREASISPSLLWLALAPSLTDSVGNSHRAELNVEKLWNLHQPGRGQLGLVEFRAFRMQHTPERAAALASLIRAILAMLIARGGADRSDDDADWGARLHERFALPYYLEEDLRSILGELESAGVGLGRPLQDELEVDHWRVWSTVEVGDFTVTVSHAIEFWSLVGDATRQDGTSRLMDASTRRIELAVRGRPDVRRPDRREGADANTDVSPDRLDSVRVRVEGIDLPLRSEVDARGPVRLFGVRYRAFVPSAGLHPTLGAQSPIHIVVLEPGRDDALEVTLHEWRPDGAAYDGVPADLGGAQARRTARAVTRRVPLDEIRPAREAPRGALSPYSLDLRYCAHAG